MKCGCSAVFSQTDANVTQPYHLATCHLALGHHGDEGNRYTWNIYSRCYNCLAESLSSKIQLVNLKMCSGLKRNKNKTAQNYKSYHCVRVELEGFRTATWVFIFGSVLQNIGFKMKQWLWGKKCWLSASNSVWGLLQSYWVNGVTLTAATHPLPPQCSRAAGLNTQEKPTNAPLTDQICHFISVLLITCFTVKYQTECKNEPKTSRSDSCGIGLADWTALSGFANKYWIRQPYLAATLVHFLLLWGCKHPQVNAENQKPNTSVCLKSGESQRTTQPIEFYINLFTGVVLPVSFPNLH